MNTATKPTTVEDEQRLIRQARQGSREAFVDLVRRHHQAVRRRIARYVGDVHAVDDLAQEVFLAAYRGMQDLSNTTAFPSWLLGIARNQAISYLRAEAARRRRAGCLLDADLVDWQADSVAASPADETDELNLQQTLLDCISELSAGNRKLIKQYYFDGDSAESIAQQMQRKAGAVRMMLLRIRRALGACIQHKLGGREDD